MTNYTVASSDATFHSIIRVTQTTDTNHAENINAAPKMVFENTLVNRRDIAALENSVVQMEITISSDEWQNNSAGGLYKDINIERVTDRMLPLLTLHREHAAVAAQCGFGRTAETIDGGLRVYAEQAPSSDITATLTLFCTVSSGPLTNIATSQTAGAVKGSDSLIIDPDGTAHVWLTDDNFADDSEVQAALEEVFG